MQGTIGQIGMRVVLSDDRVVSSKPSLSCIGRDETRLTSDTPSSEGTTTLRLL